jgi:hypothetical protein
MYYLRSEHGSVRIRKGNFSYDTIEPRLASHDKNDAPAHENENDAAEDAENTSQEAQGTINCATSCQYVGDIYIRTTYGDIEIVLGCDSKSCLSG